MPPRVVLALVLVKRGVLLKVLEGERATAPAGTLRHRVVHHSKRATHHVLLKVHLPQEGKTQKKARARE